MARDGVIAGSVARPGAGRKDGGGRFADWPVGPRGTVKDNRRDRRLAKNQNGKRRVVVVVRERGGSMLPAVFKSESAALGWITAHLAAA
jgi:hypothetical protein